MIDFSEATEVPFAERLVMALLAQNMKNAEIAGLMGVTPRYVYKMRKQITVRRENPGSPPESEPQCTPDPLIPAIKAVFLAQYKDEKPDWRWPAQMTAIKRLAARARKQPDPEEHIKRVLETFAWLLMRSQDRFWRTQPFTPMTLDSEAIYTRVCKYMEGEKSVVDEALRSMTK